MSDLLTPAVLFVAVLSLVFLLFPALYLYKMAREWRLFERYLKP